MGVDDIDLLVLGYISNGPLSGRETRVALVKLCAMQAELIPRLRGVLMNGAFERAWDGMERQKKIEMVLAALVYAASVVHERARADCPEMSLFGIIGDGDEGVVPLLHAIAAHDSDTEAFIFHHPKFVEETKFMADTPPGHWMLAYAKLRSVNRSLFISATLEAIIAAVTGTKHDRSRWSRGKDEDQCGIDACFQCGTTAAGADAIPDGFTSSTVPSPKPLNLMKCSSCQFAIYCSAKCQKQNWVTHKSQCAGIKRVETPENPHEKRKTFGEMLSFERAAQAWR
ncbi:hypothetical protein C8F01DRAFT_1256728 [Mycena amicta]|nr:hypothetical protein C8F01DRAFT_1256728 [Mycena amicta]